MWLLRLLVKRGHMLLRMVLTSQSREPTVAMCVRLSAGVLARFHTLRAEDVVEARAAVRTGAHPGLHRFEHCAVHFVVHVPDGGMVEYAQAVLDNHMLVNIGVFPGVQDARSDILHNNGRNVTGRLVEDVGKVVL